MPGLWAVGKCASLFVFDQFVLSSNLLSTRTPGLFYGLPGEVCTMGNPASHQIPTTTLCALPRYPCWLPAVLNDLDRSVQHCTLPGDLHAQIHSMIPKKLKQLKGPGAEKWIMKCDTCVQWTISLKKKGNSSTCCNTDEP